MTFPMLSQDIEALNAKKTNNMQGFTWHFTYVPRVAKDGKLCYMTQNTL